MSLSPLSPQVMTPGLYYYYVTELAFYWSLVFSQFTDIKRKVSGTAVAWCSLPAVMVISDGHMFCDFESFVYMSLVMWSNRPNSIRIPWLPLKQISSGTLFLSMWVSYVWHTSFNPPLLPQHAADASHDSSVRCICFLKLWCGAASARFVHLTSPPLSFLNSTDSDVACHGIIKWDEWH